MKMKAVIPLVLAVVFGLVAALLVKNAINRKNAPSPNAGNMVTVVVAKDDISPGSALTLADLTTSKIPANVTPAKVFSDPASLVGRVAKIELSKGQTILDTLLADAGSGSGLQALVPDGMRAVTLQVNEYSGVGGMLEPGCRVDVISVVPNPKTNESVARTVLQDVKVTAVGHYTSPAAIPTPAVGQAAVPPDNVTLLCKPAQAQILELSAMSGHPWLVLRSTRDGSVLPMQGTTMAELRGDNDKTTAVASAKVTPPALPVVPPAPVTDTDPTDPFANTPGPVAKADSTPAPTTMKQYVQVIRGGTETRVAFDVPIPPINTYTAGADTDSVIPN